MTPGCSGPSFRLRAKAEQYEDGTEPIILRTARYDDERAEIDTGEVCATSREFS
ncbi:hypothetical protein ACFW9O_35975 [Streptomyces sp. NPDC059499]|uniref:hypothetical protein n=1 Tax=Streptomyces sp. NPDC059499 TaxID=3346852 RepID=UPI0036CB39EB